MGARLDCASPPLSGERELCRARSEDRALDPERSAEVSQRAFAGVEKTGVTHGPADSLRPANDLGIASRGSQDAENPGVEHGHNLGQPGGDRDFADAQYELAQSIIDAVPASIRLTSGCGGADSRTFPYSGALDEVPIKQLRKDVA